MTKKLIDHHTVENTGGLLCSDIGFYKIACIGKTKLHNKKKRKQGQARPLLYPHHEGSKFPQPKPILSNGLIPWSAPATATSTGKPYVLGAMRTIGLNQKEQIRQIKQDLAKHPRFKSRCHVCHCKKSKSGFTFHHLWYESYEPTYKDFKTPLEYYQNLKLFVKANPKRFLYVCSDHHQAIERNARWGTKNFERLIRAVRLTNQNKDRNRYDHVVL